ncbi:MAG: SDR family oxidoreductase [Halieaceae bacterium]
MQANQRTALITGASAGLGKEFARQLAAQGYQLVLVARNADKLEETAASLRQEYKVNTHCICADLCDESAPQALFDELQQRGLEIDYLVNNAGVAGPNLLEETDWQQQRDFYQLMMLSMAQLCHLLVPPMQSRGFGRVINIASVAGRLARAGGCNYGPSKAWVIAMSEELALTVAGDGVLVCALCPGYTHTEFHQRAQLMDMKNSMPKWMWYDAEVVVREGLRACERGKRVYSSGRLYRWLDPLFQSVFTRRLFTMNDGR